jgi:hypothetical protein
VVFKVQVWTGLDLGRWTIGIFLLFWIPAYWIGRRLRQFRASSEIEEVESVLELARNPDASV